MALFDYFWAQKWRKLMGIRIAGDLAARSIWISDDFWSDGPPILPPVRV